MSKFCPECGTGLTRQVVDSEERSACAKQDCQYVLWNNPTPVVAMIVETSEGIVFARNVQWPRHFYSVITGFLEAGEEPADCAVRETKEELGLDASRCSLVGVCSFAQQNQVIIGYHLHAEGKITLNEELDDYRFMQREEIRPWDMGTGLILQQWLQQSV